MNRSRRTPKKNPTLRAFQGDPNIKARYLEQVGAHERADEIIQGEYWIHGKGCAVGCLMHSYNPHRLFPRRMGVPVPIAHFLDRIFEDLPSAQAKGLPRQFVEAIPVGADLRYVSETFLSWLTDPDGLDLLKRAPEMLKPAAERVRRLYQRRPRRGDFVAWRDYRIKIGEQIRALKLSSRQKVRYVRFLDWLDELMEWHCFNLSYVGRFSDGLPDRERLPFIKRARDQFLALLRDPPRSFPTA